MNALYYFRDHYFEEYGMENANNKASDLDKKSKETLKTLDKLQCNYNNCVLIKTDNKYDNNQTDFSRFLNVQFYFTQSFSDLESIWIRIMITNHKIVFL